MPKNAKKTNEQELDKKEPENKTSSKTTKKASTSNKKNDSNKKEDSNKEVKATNTTSTKKKTASKANANKTNSTNTNKKTSSTTTTKKSTASKNSKAKASSAAKKTDNTTRKSTTKKQDIDKENDKNNKKEEEAKETKKVKQEENSINNTVKKESKKDKNKNNNKNKKIEQEENKDVDEEKEEIVVKEHTKLIKFEEIKNIFKKKKKIPKTDKKHIRKPIVHNILVMIVAILYFVFLILGHNNIENQVYQTDLKVFAICILFLAIVILEKAYKSGSGKTAMYGIESLIIAVITLGLIYVNLMYSSHYINVLLIILGIVTVYYLIKSIIIYLKGRKKYFVNDMKKMINTEE